jgi:preprotein translocase subunit SecG
MRRAGDSAFKGRSIPVAVLLISVVLLSTGSGIYAGASFFAQQAPNVTITTTIYTTTTWWTTSTIWSTVTQVVKGVLTTVQYTTSTSTITITGTTTYPPDTPADHDAWTENIASQWFYDTNRGTLTADSSVKQVGSYSLKGAKSPVTGWQYMQYPSTHNLALDLTAYAGLKFYVREDIGLNVKVRLYTSDGNWFERTIRLAAGDTWYLQDLPVGSGAGGWTIVGSPNWASINFIEFGSVSDAASAQRMYIDGVYFYRH